MKIFLYGLLFFALVVLPSLNIIPSLKIYDQKRLFELIVLMAAGLFYLASNLRLGYWREFITRASNGTLNSLLARVAPLGQANSRRGTDKLHEPARKYVAFENLRQRTFESFVNLKVKVGLLLFLPSDC